MHVVHGTTCVARVIAVITMVREQHHADWHLKNERNSHTKLENAHYAEYLDLYSTNPSM